MKRTIALLAIILVAFSATGCSSKSSDLQILEKAFENMNTMQSCRTEASITFKFMGMTMGPIDYEILVEKPDKTYMKTKGDLLGLGEESLIEILNVDGKIQMRSDLFDELPPEMFDSELEDSLAEELDNPQQFEEILLSLANTTEFKLLDNPASLDSKNYKTYEIILDGETLTEIIREAMDLEDSFVPPEIEDPEELEIYNQLMDSLSVEMVSQVVVDLKTNYFHSLDVTVNISLTMPETVPGLLEFDMTGLIKIKYLEVNTQLAFPEF